MRLKFIFIGRTRSPYLAEGIQDYLRRINGYFPAEEITIKGVKALDERAVEVRAGDAGRLLGAVRPQDVFVHLDPRGRDLDSEQLAAWFKQQIEQRVKAVSFGLGGPLGLDETVVQRADLRLKLSSLTLTHEMSRLVLLEQIYRTLRLNAGHPYHK